MSIINYDPRAIPPITLQSPPQSFLNPLQFPPQFLFNRHSNPPTRFPFNPSQCFPQPPANCTSIFSQPPSISSISSQSPFNLPLNHPSNLPVQSSRLRWAHLSTDEERLLHGQSINRCFNCLKLPVTLAVRHNSNDVTCPSTNRHQAQAFTVHLTM